MARTSECYYYIELSLIPNVARTSECYYYIELSLIPNVARTSDATSKMSTFPLVVFASLFGLKRAKRTV